MCKHTAKHTQQPQRRSRSKSQLHLWSHQADALDWKPGHTATLRWLRALPTAGSFPAAPMSYSCVPIGSHRSTARLPGKNTCTYTCTYSTCVHSQTHEPPHKLIKGVRQSESWSAETSWSDLLQFDVCSRFVSVGVCVYLIQVMSSTVSGS